MNKHKCGSCRFYQEARLASSGWCHHPQRKTTNDLMIMVRKNELACRDEWDHHLWEARTDAGSLAAAPTIADPFPDRKMPPATELDIAALLGSEQSTAEGQARGDDVVLSELGAALEPPKYAQRPESLPSWSLSASRSVESPPVSAAVSQIGTRSAIIRAREAYRERSRLESVRTAEVARLVAQASPAAPVDIAAGASVSDVVHPNEQPEPARVDDVTADRSTATGPGAWVPHPESDASPPAARPLSTIPEDVEPSQVDPDPSLAAARQPEDRLRPHQTFSQRHEGSGADDRRETVAASRSQTYQAHDEQFDAFSIRPQASGDVPTRSTDATSSLEPSKLGWFNEQMPPTSNQVEATTTERHTEADTTPRTSRLMEYDSNDVEYDNINRPVSHQSFEGDSTAQPPAADEVDPSQVLTYADESWLDIDVVVDDETEAPYPPAGLALSAHLPRICQTCRDFRPAEAGNRGWCANPWAFSHRRMVDAGDEIPCDGILGHWWLPVDEVWSQDADVSSHGQPTPLLDAWLPQHRDDLPARRRS